MSVSFAEILGKFRSLLKLDNPPIAISFLSKPPGDVERVNEPAFACAIWGKARDKAVYATCKDHYPCPIGAEVMGFKLPPEQVKAKEEISSFSLNSGYKSAKAIKLEAETTPKIKVNRGVVIYSPLQVASSSPVVVLFVLRPVQAMLLAEAIGRETGENTLGVSNLPGCGVVALTYETGKPAFGLACHGSRQFASVKHEYLLFTIPGKRLVEIVNNLEKRMEAQKKFDEEFGKRYNLPFESLI